ncbi:MAG: hypothetical protein JO126_02315 [Alphaproteobacteria bacterium]|nr:hypothetical protein [Alphaproteobacteria bacterium]MBV8548274.1 hypothetical protein [Alphaproteobacteria bacterium]
MAGRYVTIPRLKALLANAKDRLSSEKRQLLELYPVNGALNREGYGFAYLRAERVGLAIINDRLEDVAWLPMHLDPAAEMMDDHRAALKKWIASEKSGAPSMDDFGNDFIHVLTRSALHAGWEAAEWRRLATRVANLFHDLSCLIGMIYYTTWFEENDVEAISLTDPGNLGLSAMEMTALAQSEELNDQILARRKLFEKAAKHPMIGAKSKARNTPHLTVIENTGFNDPLLGEPLPI